VGVQYTKQWEKNWAKSEFVMPLTVPLCTLTVVSRPDSVLMRAVSPSVCLTGRIARGHQFRRNRSTHMSRTGEQRVPNALWLCSVTEICCGREDLRQTSGRSSCRVGCLKHHPRWVWMYRPNFTYRHHMNNMLYAPASLARCAVDRRLGGHNQSSRMVA
jgi:hypothetical protein